MFGLLFWFIALAVAFIAGLTVGWFAKGAKINKLKAAEANAYQLGKNVVVEAKPIVDKIEGK